MSYILVEMYHKIILENVLLNIASVACIEIKNKKSTGQKCGPETITYAKVESVDSIIQTYVEAVRSNITVT